MCPVRVLVLLGVLGSLATSETAQANQLTVDPQVVYMARDATAASTIKWVTSQDADVWVSVNGQPLQPFETNDAGNRTVSISEGRTTFVVRAADGEQRATASVQGLRSGSLSASPSEVAVPDGGVGATTIAWEMAEQADAEVWVAVNGQPETLFARARRGYETAAVIPAGMTIFKLYKGTERRVLLDWASVTGKASSASAAGPPPAIPASCQSSPVSAGARLVARVKGVRSQRGREAHVRYGKRVRMRGRLTRSDGAPLAGAAVCVVAREAVSTGRIRSADSVTTDARGRFSYVLSPGPSRSVEFVHRLGERAASASVMVRVRAPVRLRASRRALRSSQGLTLSGRVRAQDVPMGTLVEIQAQRGRRWQTFGTARTGREARFRFRYSFTRTLGVQKYRLRARVPTQAGLPFAPGASRPVVVRVSG